MNYLTLHAFWLRNYRCFTCVPSPGVKFDICFNESDIICWFAGWTNISFACLIRYTHVFILSAASSDFNNSLTIRMHISSSFMLILCWAQTVLSRNMRRVESEKRNCMLGCVTKKKIREGFSSTRNQVGDSQTAFNSLKSIHKPHNTCAFTSQQNVTKKRKKKIKKINID